MDLQTPYVTTNLMFNSNQESFESKAYLLKKFQIKKKYRQITDLCIIYKKRVLLKHNFAYFCFSSSLFIAMMSLTPCSLASHVSIIFSFWPFNSCSLCPLSSLAFFPALMALCILFMSVLILSGDCMICGRSLLQASLASMVFNFSCSYEGELGVNHQIYFGSLDI